MEVGDLVFHDTSSGRVGHAGMQVGGGKFISATSSDGVRVRSLRLVLGAALGRSNENPRNEVSFSD